VGIARALAIEPDILLMDEPFSMLDEITAKKLREDLTDIWLKEEAESGKRRTMHTSLLGRKEHLPHGAASTPHRLFPLHYLTAL